MIRPAVESVIREHELENWLNQYPWLVGYLGSLASPIWFIGENPSLAGVESIARRSLIESENLQWNSHEGDRLFREALTEAGLKRGAPERDEGWRCYITNAIKEPERVATRNELKRNARYWQRQAERWWPVLQAQIDSGRPKVFVALGAQTHKILRYMIHAGLKCPPIVKIDHYSYVMFRPEARTKRGPRHPDRIAEFKASVRAIADQYDA